MGGTMGPLILSAALATVAVVSLCVWTFRKRAAMQFAKKVKKKALDNKELDDDEKKKVLEDYTVDVDDRRQINRNSLFNVISEGIFLFSGATSMCLWLFRYAQKCEM